MTRQMVAALLLFGLASAGCASSTIGPRAERTPVQQSAQPQMADAQPAGASNVETDQLLFDEASPADLAVNDPWEPFNRRVFAFNEVADQYALEPGVKAYRAVTPRSVRNRIRDFIDNLKTPVWFANDVLQADFRGARDQVARFALNSTVGVLGFYDFADHVAGIDKVDEDFGQTLGVWGVGEGPYLVLPILGPSNVRDTTGRVVDFAFDPLTYVEGDDIVATRIGLTFVDNLDLRERLDPVVQAARDSADPYVQARAFYTQNRRGRIFDERGDNYDDLPDFDE